MSGLAIDDIKVCYCFEGSGCDCYKPKPGMLVEAAEAWRIDLAESFLVGDRWRDIGASDAVGCETDCVDYGDQEKRPVNPDYTVASLYDAGQIVLEKVRFP
jgi:D-glycero-D-manno-heptose 1,7-bisphosphate phosphatase